MSSRDRVATEALLAEIAERVDRGVTAIPAVMVAPLVGNPTHGDEEVMVVMVSDAQLGHRTPSTNAKVVQRRMRNLAQNVIRVAGLHREMYPVRKLVVLMMGD